MKKILALIAVLVMVVTMLCGCNVTKNDEKTTVVTTIFPIYDWARNVIGDDDSVKLTYLLDDGVDMHSYQATTADIITIADCDVFIYVGGEADAWVEGALNQAINNDMVVINLMEELSDNLLEEEITDGMQHEHEHEDDHECDADCDHEHEHEHEFDEHIWLSLDNAQLATKAIAEKLGSINEKGASNYTKNANDYCDELVAIDKLYKEAVADATFDTVLFADRFPFRYLIEDYNLNYYAAFAGCSAESEASFATITFLAQKVDELNLNCVLVVKGAKHDLANTIIDNTTGKDQQIITLNSMEAVTQKQVDDGASYAAIMLSNLTALTEAIK